MNDEDNDDDIWSDDVPLTFEGPCTCEHEQEKHGFLGCEVEGCKCEAHWEE